MTRTALAPLPSTRGDPAKDVLITRDDDRRYFDLVGNLPWALHNCWSQYRYSMDDTLLREARTRSGTRSGGRG